MTNAPTTQTPPELIDAAAEIEEQLTLHVESLQLPQHLKEAASYAVVQGGKRVRTALTLLCAQAVGGSREHAMSAAIAVEYIHCFSLVHDDLPAIDNDSLRRGKPTLHIQTSEAMALLAGDLLLPLAFAQLTEAPYLPQQQAKLSHLLATATRDMVIGQVYDTLGGLPVGLDMDAQL